jgi:putative colanic acid biosynthesis acetyltransferase WcaF
MSPMTPDKNESLALSTPLDAGAANPRFGGPSFSLGSRMFRLVWVVSWTLFASWTPSPMHAWRRFILSVFGANLHRTAKVYPSVKIWYPPNLSMGAYSCLGPRVDCYCMAEVKLGQHSLVSQGAQICAGTHDVDDADFQLICRPISIGAHAWVAASAFVGPGVSIGEGAVLGACSVSFKDLIAWTIYVGNPARATRARAKGEL